MPKPCPSLARQIPEGPWLAAGRTQMMLGVRVMKTWNPTTKEFETMVRPGISKGTNGEKVFRFRPDQLI
jgi:hypothetical protein